jgi:hypothetical protein
MLKAARYAISGHVGQAAFIYRAVCAPGERVEDGIGSYRSGSQTGTSTSTTAMVSTASTWSPLHVCMAYDRTPVKLAGEPEGMQRGYADTSSTS